MLLFSVCLQIILKSKLIFPTTMSGDLLLFNWVFFMCVLSCAQKSRACAMTMNCLKQNRIWSWWRWMGEDDFNNRRVELEKHRESTKSTNFLGSSSHSQNCIINESITSANERECMFSSTNATSHYLSMAFDDEWKVHFANFFCVSVSSFQKNQQSFERKLTSYSKIILRSTWKHQSLWSRQKNLHTKAN